jgi:hypothetical protein
MKFTSLNNKNVFPQYFLKNLFTFYIEIAQKISKDNFCLGFTICAPATARSRFSAFKNGQKK